MNKNNGRSLVVIERNDWNQGYSVRSEFNTDIPYNVAKIVYEISEDFWYDNDEFAEYCNKDCENRSIECFSDYCKFIGKNKLAEINDFVVNKSFETIEEFFQENKIGEIINAYFLYGEQIADEECIETLNEGFNQWSESIYFYDKKCDKDLEIVISEC